MSASDGVRAMQVVTLRMLHDDAFRAAVYRDPVGTLAEAGLPAGAAAWFAAPDPRAWEVDPLRNARALTAILEEFPATGLALAAEGWRLPRLHRFFSARAFHEGLAAWRTLVDCFGAWIADGDARSGVRGLAALERAVAMSRRARPTDSGTASGLRAADGVVTVRVPEGTLTRYVAARRWLARAAGGGAAAVARALQQGAPRGLPALGAAAGADVEGLAVVRRADGEPSVVEVGEGVVGLLAWLGAGRGQDAAVAWLGREGLEAGEATSLLDELVADGVLVGG
jgi:hypothetical protein